MGRSGPRCELWDSLLGWARSNCFDGEGHWQFESGDGKALSVAYLVGRSGGGKSRLAAELGRTLANRREFGGDLPKRGRWARFQAWVRHNRFFWLRPRIDDPWDAGLVRPRGDARFPQLLDALKKWRPRRPTFLILDDPAPSQASDLILALAACAGRHPIRLLIVSQVLADSDLRWDPQAHLWISGRTELNPQPFSLAPEAWFSEAEVRDLLSDPHLTSINVRQLMRSDPMARRAVMVTRGNPLLVGLAARWLGRGEPLEDMDAQSLLVHRAERIFVSLQSIHIRRLAALEFLAVATLVDGASRMAIRQALPPGDGPTTEELSRVFPTEIDGLTQRCPPFRPEVVGEAVVRRRSAPWVNLYEGRYNRPWGYRSPDRRSARTGHRIALDRAPVAALEGLYDAIQDCAPHRLEGRLFPFPDV